MVRVAFLSLQVTNVCATSPIYFVSLHFVSGCVSVQGHGASRGRRTRGRDRRRLGFLLLFRPDVPFVVLVLVNPSALFLPVAFTANPATRYAIAGVPRTGLSSQAAPARPPRFQRELHRLRKNKKWNVEAFSETVLDGTSRFSGGNWGMPTSLSEHG